MFLNSALTHGPGATGTEVAVGDAAATYVARSSGNIGQFDNVGYINCRMDSHVASVGWADAVSAGQPMPNPETPSAESGWKEYGSTDLDGNALDLGQRSTSAYVLTNTEYEAGYATRDLIFADYGTTGWSPTP